MKAIRSVLSVILILLIVLTISAGVVFAENGRLFGVMRTNTLGSRLTGNDAIVYKAVKEAAEEIAAGERDSSRIRVPISEMIGGKMTYTADDLGVDELVKDDKIAEEAVDKLNSLYRFDESKVQQALLADLPYELYWYDKVNGFKAKTDGTSITARNDGSGWIISFDDKDPEWVLDYHVSCDYSKTGKSRTTDIDTDKTSAAAEVAETAKDIVEENADKRDLEKLKAYKDKICELTSYNHEVSIDSKESGNPWQLIYVFDGDDSTTVVCEGYSKAFQLLCDLTTFSSSEIHSYLVSGDIVNGSSSERHSWNIVHMNDGRNYIADITNCEENTVGTPDLLFLTGCKSGSINDGYTYQCGSDIITYKYDENTLKTYDTGELVMSDSAYKKVKNQKPNNPMIRIVYDSIRPLIRALRFWLRV